LFSGLREAKWDSLDQLLAELLKKFDAGQSDWDLFPLCSEWIAQSRWAFGLITDVQAERSRMQGASRDELSRIGRFVISTMRTLTYRLSDPPFYFCYGWLEWDKLVRGAFGVIPQKDRNHTMLSNQTHDTLVLANEKYERGRRYWSTLLGEQS
jgi:hypothetical protein